MSQITSIDKNVDEIDLKTLLNILWSFKKFIIRVAFLFGLIALLVSGIGYVLTNQEIVYEAESIVSIKTDESIPWQKEVYVSVLGSQLTINEVIKHFRLTNQFSNDNITISELNDSDSIRIKVMYPDQEMVLKITDSIVNKSIIMTNDVLNGVQVSTLGDASLTGSIIIAKEKPKLVLNVVIALVLGGMVSVFVVFFMEFIMDRVKTVEDIEKGLNLEVLAILPNNEPKINKGWPWKK